MLRLVKTHADLGIAIPKKDTIFRLEVPLPPHGDEAVVVHEARVKPEKKPLVLELHGNQFEMRAADRANKKFKWKSMENV
jgi:ribonuclease P protein subunit POP4